MKPKPSARSKHRYVVFACGEKARGKEIVHRALLHFLGELGVSKASPALIEYNDGNGVGILRCARGEMVNVEAALAFSHPERVKVIGVSGTLRKAREKFANVFKGGNE